jgi:glycosyltransferase involved in cell wall biosynthesis
LRIGIDARYLNGEFSGIATYSENLLKGLSAIDRENDYEVFIHPGYRKPLGLGENFRVRHFTARPVSLATMWKFGKILNKLDLDLLHAHFPLAPVTFDGPLLVTVHDLQALTVPEFTARRNWLKEKAYNAFYHWAYPLTIKRANYIITDSKATRDDVAHFFPRKLPETIVIHPGLEDVYWEEPELEEQTVEKFSLPEQYVLYLGSTRPNKNLPRMIRAFALMLRQAGERPGSLLDALNLVLVVHSDRFFRECRQLIRKLKIQERVKIFHDISEAEKRVFYRRCRALYFVTKHEGFGFPLLEAQACGAPVLASNHAALPEIAGASALIVDPDSTKAIAEGLKRLVLDEDLRQRLIAAGRENAAQFKWARTCRRVLEVYHHLY